MLPNFFETKSGDFFINQKLIYDVRKQNADKIVARIWGNNHNKLGLVQHETPFDFVHPMRKIFPQPKGKNIAILPDLR